MNKMNKAIGMATLWLAATVSAPAALRLGDDFTFGSRGGVMVSLNSPANGVLLQNNNTDLPTPGWICDPTSAKFSGSQTNGFLSLTPGRSGACFFNSEKLSGKKVILEVFCQYKPGKSVPANGSAFFEFGFERANTSRALHSQDDRILGRVYANGAYLIAAGSKTGNLTTGINQEHPMQQAFPVSAFTNIGVALTVDARYPNARTASLVVEIYDVNWSPLMRYTPVSIPLSAYIPTDVFDLLSQVAIDFHHSEVDDNTPSDQKCALNLDSAGTYSDVWPSTFPINMSFRPLEDGDDQAPAPVLTHEKVIEKYLQFCPVNHGAKGYMQELKISRPDVMAIALPNWSVGPVAGANLWPGYFLYCAGTTLPASINATQTTVAVKSVENITVGDTVGIFKVNSANKSPDWEYFENAYVSAVDTTDNVLTLRRASVGGAARQFPKDSRVAAHAYAWKRVEKDDNGNVLGYAVQWLYNCSLHAPKKSGAPSDEQEGYQMMLKQVKAENEAVKSNLNGVEHDMSRAIPSNDTVPIDCNNDETGDAGFIGGIPSFYLGMQRYTQGLRDWLGPKAIIQFDCTLRRHGYRGWKNVNGIQMEDAVRGDDAGYLNYSGAFEQLSVWAEKAADAPRISYGYSKDVTETYGGERGRDSKFRADFAMGLMLGQPHPFSWERDPLVTTPAFQQRSFYDWDECHGGTLNNWSWLGKPLGAAIRDMSNCDLTNNLLAGKTWNVVNKNGYTYTTSGTTSDVNGQEINVTAINGQGCDLLGVTLKLASGFISGLSTNAEYTLKFTAKGEDSYATSSGTFDQMPRWVNVSNHVSSGGNTGMLADGSWRTVYLTFKTASTASNPTFGVSETKGRTWIKDIALYKGSADRWSREFENGIVFLNATNTVWTPTLPPLPFGWKYYQLKNNTTEQAGHNPNNGSEVIGRLVTVPPKDAVYLLKSQTAPPAM